MTKSAWILTLLTEYICYTSGINKTVQFIYKIENDTLHHKCENNDQQFYVWDEKSFCGGDCTSSEETTKLNCIRQDNQVFFPKCCSPDRLYEINDHKCVAANVNDTVMHHLNFNASLIKAGLENCKVIADYVIENFEESVIINTDRSVHYRNGTYKFGNYCFDKIIDSDDFVLRLCHGVEVCQKRDNADKRMMRCIKKCCPDGQMFVGKTCAPRTGGGLPVRDNGDVIRDANETFAVIISTYFSKYIADKTKGKFYIDTEGIFYLKVGNKMYQYQIEETIYCMESIDKRGNGLFFLLANQEISVNYKVSRIALSLSCIFLTVTLLAFGAVKELKNFLGKLIMCYCFSLLMGFATTAVVQFNPLVGFYCKVVGYIITFSFIAAFSWMTLISYNIWNVLGSMKTRYGKSKSKEMTKFLWYNLCGWSVPIMITGFAAIDCNYWILPDNFHPFIGEKECLIEKHRDYNFGYFLYITLPCGILVVSNVIIYFKTVYYIMSVKKQIDKMSHVTALDEQKKMKLLSADRERVMTMIKLFLLMGINWAFDVVVSIIDFKQNSTLRVIEMIFDTFNCLQGVFIFSIFVLKAKILKALAEKLGIAAKTTATSTDITLRTLSDHQ